MECDLQKFDGYILRIGKDGFRYGDPYTWVAGCRINGCRAEVVGAMVAPSPSEWRAIYRRLTGLGVREVHFERIAGAAPGEHIVRARAHKVMRS